ncbi:conserved exported hypothetical protein [Candidatus Defluviicoccus seviourii]|uniref:DUF4136 domain-containing protein n=1 Tax=Candidatus Defluviicoccus seviourii TaxID=2565273 RepID=A0A564W9V4_9PROT|nr:conserved exported hypothetical protein [Candidatus Defluviicoccus seviourii]
MHSLSKAIVVITVAFTIAILAACSTKERPEFQYQQQSHITQDQQKFHITIDSLASVSAPQYRTYILLPGNTGVTWDDLQFQEYAVYVMRVLHSRGFVLAHETQNAEVAIVLSYGIGTPEARQYSFSLPVLGQTGVSSAHTYGAATSYGNTATYSGTTTYLPSYGITGLTTYTGTVTEYFRYTLITAYDFKEFKQSGRQVQLWHTTVTSSGSSGDLRRVFPVLLGAAAPYLATSTGRQVERRLDESDNIVKAIKGEPVQ